jgi:hypothetical protein
MSRHPAPTVDLERVRAAEARLERLLAEKPHLRERTAAMLASELPCPDLEKPMPPPTQTPLNLRVPPALLARAEALVPVAGAAPELGTLPSVTRADVLRLALLRGLAVLEAELAPGPEV